VADHDELQVMRDALQAAWVRFVDMLTPLRPTLHAYCRRLTGSVWDAEDLAQETLLRAFGHWGSTHPPIRDPHAYLLRTATNLWIDGARRQQASARLAADLPPAQPAPAPDASSHLRDAGARLFADLSPQERAALVLKEAFDMSITDIAALLATTPGAVKAALHRGRGRLAAPARPAAARPAVTPAVLDRFIDRFAAKDVEGLLALMLDGAVAENVGNSRHVGADAPDGLRRFIHALVFAHPEWATGTHYESARLEACTIEGEPVLLLLVTRRGREALMSVLRFDTVDGGIARIRSYGFCPDTIRLIGEALDRRTFTGLYRAPSPAPAAP
jgi:RNA polymerase sigma-70 factor (ECF subfamily)